MIRRTGEFACEKEEFFLASFGRVSAGCRNEKYHETFINVSISRDPFAIIDYKKGGGEGRGATIIVSREEEGREGLFKSRFYGSYTPDFRR